MGLMSQRESQSEATRVLPGCPEAVQDSKFVSVRVYRLRSIPPSHALRKRIFNYMSQTLPIGNDKSPHW
jgi:hypothetical protein